MIKRILYTLSIAFTASLLTQCGGMTTLAEGGITGTGITAVGRIGGFGSIWVNGVRYDVDQADFYRDESPASGQQAYRTGEIITLKANLNKDGSASAQSVHFNKTLAGHVTSPSTDGSSLVVLNQTVHTDGLTIFHHFKNLTDLQRGNMLEISGRKDAQQRLIASSITLLTTQFTPGTSLLETEGQIKQLDTQQKTFTLNNLVIDYAQAHIETSSTTDTLRNGLLVEVISTQPLQSNGHLRAQFVTEKETRTFPAEAEIELEGIITRFSDSTSFQVNGQAVITSADTRYEHGSAADLKLNVALEVEGTIDQNGVLIAEEIALQQSYDDDETEEWEGRIDHIDATKGELIIGRHVFITDDNTIIREERNDTEITLTLEALSVGDTVEIYGRRLNNGRILALRIERDTDKEDQD